MGYEVWEHHRSSIELRSRRTRSDERGHGQYRVIRFWTPSSEIWELFRESHGNAMRLTSHSLLVRDDTKLPIGNRNTHLM
jgi:hypothetical protein